MQTQLFWILGEKYYTFLSFLPKQFPNIFGMKNRNVKNLDLCYLKNYKFSVDDFWICCVLCYG
jgi:hypothetical protein